MENKSTRQEYIHDLAELQNKVIQMGGLVTTAIERATHSLITQDRDLARQIMKEDDDIDDLTIEIEDFSLLLIAKQQPIAHDLRVIATSFKIASDLERIGDHAFDIAKTAKALAAEKQPVDLLYTPQLAETALVMVKQAMKAYREADIVLAEAVCRQDDELDELFARSFTELSGAAVNDVVRARQQAQLLFVARYLERIGDHATNIAEWVVYLETAERVRKLR